MSEKSDSFVKKFYFQECEDTPGSYRASDNPTCRNDKERQVTLSVEVTHEPLTQALAIPTGIVCPPNSPTVWGVLDERIHRHFANRIFTSQEICDFLRTVISLEDISLLEDDD